MLSRVSRSWENDLTPPVCAYVSSSSLCFSGPLDSIAESVFFSLALIKLHEYALLRKVAISSFISQLWHLRNSVVFHGSTSRKKAMKRRKKGEGHSSIEIGMPLCVEVEKNVNRKKQLQIRENVPKGIGNKLLVVHVTL